MASHPQYRFFTTTDREQLLDLLAFTDLVQLELLALALIPNPSARFKLRELNILKLSGTCSFRKTVISILSLSLNTRSR